MEQQDIQDIHDLPIYIYNQQIKKRQKIHSSKNLNCESTVNQHYCTIN